MIDNTKHPPRSSLVAAVHDLQANARRLRDEADDAGRSLNADLLARMALDAQGEQAVDDFSDTQEVETVNLGPVRFKIVDPHAEALATAAGAIEPGAAPFVCMRVAFYPGDDAPAPLAGQYIALPTPSPRVTLMFVVWVTHDDLHDSAAPDLGAGAVRNEVLDQLQPGEALLVQVTDTEDL